MASRAPSSTRVSALLGFDDPVPDSISHHVVSVIDVSASCLGIPLRARLLIRQSLVLLFSANERDSGQQVGGDSALEHEGIGAGVHHRPPYALLVVDAEDDHPDIRAALPKGSQPAEAAVLSQGEVHDRDVWAQASRPLKQRRLIGHHDHRSERRLEQATHAFREVVMAVGQ
jgi:hypothetical protein